MHYLNTTQTIYSVLGYLKKFLFSLNESLERDEPILENEFFRYVLPFLSTTNEVISQYFVLYQEEFEKFS